MDQTVTDIQTATKSGHGPYDQRVNRSPKLHLTRREQGVEWTRRFTTKITKYEDCLIPAALR